MSARFLLLACTLVCLYHASGAAEAVPDQLDTDSITQVLQKFIKLVDAHNLNVSIVLSEVLPWRNGQTREVNELALGLHQNKVQVYESTLTQAVQQEFEKTTKDEHILSIVALHKTVNDDSRPKVLQHSHDVPNLVQLLMNKMLHPTGTEQYKTDESDPLHTVYNFKVQSGASDVRKVQLMTAKIPLVVSEKRGIESDVIDKISKVLPKLWSTYDNDKAMAQGIVEVLDKTIPDNDWQVVVDAEEFYLPKNARYVSFNIAQQHILVYTLVAKS